MNGKQLFAEKCGSCHVLERAGTAGTIGPDLDEAFGQSRRDGLGRSTIQGVVREQIAHPRRSSQMPPDLVTGDDARDVAAYVAAVAGVPGRDTGELAQAGPAGARTGLDVFTSAGCNSCHTLAEADSQSDVGPSLDDLARVAEERPAGMSVREYVRQSIVDPDTFVAAGFEAGVMPDDYGERLDRKQIDLLVDLLARR